MLCSKCGNDETFPNARFCGQCGNPMQVAQPQQVTVVKTTPKWVIAVIIGLGVGVGALAVALLMTLGPGGKKPAGGDDPAPVAVVRDTVKDTVVITAPAPPPPKAQPQPEPPPPESPTPPPMAKDPPKPAPTPKPPAPPPQQGSRFTDARDGKTYRTVRIGTQTWMAENLNYQTGNSWCYKNDPSNCSKYGRLYDWNTAKKACPAGWHLPSNQEWTTLVNYAGGASTAGTKLKSKSPNWNGEDAYGFSALPGGRRITDGSFYDLGSWGDWWSATEFDASYAYRRDMISGYTYVIEYYYLKSYGHSVRCLQD
jgi:uncharacterized protein (TIGR02145 family)